MSDEAGICKLVKARKKEGLLINKRTDRRRDLI
jgi:hypothetical protein